MNEQLAIILRDLAMLAQQSRSSDVSAAEYVQHCESVMHRIEKAFPAPTKCTCGYDARTNQRDHNYECPIHSALCDTYDPVPVPSAGTSTATKTLSDQWRDRALSAEVREEKLKEALQCVAERKMPDGSFCWCVVDERIEVDDEMGHEIRCQTIRAALRK